MKSLHSFFLPISLTIALAAIGANPIVGVIAHAQDVTEVAMDNIPLWQPGHSVTTSIKDALPVVTTLHGYDEAYVRPIPSDWKLEPGYYRSVIRSYCLHAGAYGPTKGDGYLIAPLRGDRMPIIRNILLRSEQSPKIAQSDVQELIWGTEAGQQWKDYPDDFKARVSPLLSPQEIAVMSLGQQQSDVTDQVRSRLGGLFSGRVQKTVDAYSDVRNKITGSTTYEELESAAVKTGAAPWGKDSRKDVQPGSWAYVGDGNYIRALPQNYMTTTLEVYRVAPANVTRDSKGRITHFDSGGYTIDTAYNDDTAAETINGAAVPVWHFTSVTFKSPAGQTLTVRNQGYVVADNQPLGIPVAARGNLAYRRRDDGGLGDMGHYRDGLKTAFNPTDKKGQADWVNNHMNRVGAAWDAANNAFAGNPGPSKFNLTGNTATPANTSKQRLALSAFTE